MTLAKSHVFRSSGDTLFAQTELLTGIKTINLNLSSNHVVLPEIVTLSERKLPSSCTDWKSFSSVKVNLKGKLNCASVSTPVRFGFPRISGTRGVLPLGELSLATFDSRGTTSLS